jgi:hypothetical protein
MMPPPPLKKVAKSAARALMFASPASVLSHPPQDSSEAVMITLYSGCPEPSVNGVAFSAVASDGSTIVTGDSPIAVIESAICVPWSRPRIGNVEPLRALSTRILK